MVIDKHNKLLISGRFDYIKVNENDHNAINGKQIQSNASKTMHKNEKERKTTVVGLERGPLSLVSTTEELLDRKVAAPV
jgi:predicted peptidase